MLSFKKRVSLTFVLLSLVFPGSNVLSSGEAYEPLENMLEAESYWFAQIGLGFGDHAKNSHEKDLHISWVETDTLNQIDQKSYLGYTVGLQYVKPLSDNRWLSAVGVGPSLYYQPIKFSGQVFQFGRPILNNYNYQYKIRPINTYFEADFYFQPLFKHMTPFVLLGGGLSFTKKSYQEWIRPAALWVGVPCNSEISYSSHWDTTLAYEVGAGVLVNLSDHFFVGARYVYQGTGAAGIAPNRAQSRLKFKSNINSAYFTLGYKL